MEVSAPQRNCKGKNNVQRALLCGENAVKFYVNDALLYFLISQRLLLKNVYYSVDNVNKPYELVIVLYYGIDML